MSTYADRPGGGRDPAPDDAATTDMPMSARDALAESRPDAAMAPVIEAGGGVAEGFEESEALLVEHATEGGLDATMRILLDASRAEREAGPERGIYADADHERSSEQELD